MSTHVFDPDLRVSGVLVASLPVLELLDGLLHEACEVGLLAALEEALLDPADVAVPRVQGVVARVAADLGLETAVKSVKRVYV